MPIYEYLADDCRQTPPCLRRKQYLQQVSDPPVTTCRECGTPVRRVLSSFAARSGAVGVSAPDPTPLNPGGFDPPLSMPVGGDEECGHEH